MNSSLGSTPRSTIALLLLLALGACKSQQLQNPPPPMPVVPPTIVPETPKTPAWVGEPLSWDKLSQIDAWLASQPDGGDPYWKIEGELQLSQGRLEFARREAGGQKSPPAAAQSRINAALATFRRIAA